MVLGYGFEVFFYRSEEVLWTETQRSVRRILEFFATANPPLAKDVGFVRLKKLKKEKIIPTYNVTVARENKATVKAPNKMKVYL